MSDLDVIIEQLTAERLEGRCTHWHDFPKPGCFIDFVTVHDTHFYTQIEAVSPIPEDPQALHLSMTPVSGSPDIRIKSAQQITQWDFFKTHHTQETPEIPMPLHGVVFDLNRLGQVVYVKPNESGIHHHILQSFQTADYPVIVVDPVGISLPADMPMAHIHLGQDAALSIQEIGVNHFIEWVAQGLPKAIQARAYEFLLSLIPPTPDFIPIQYFVTHPLLKDHPLSSAILHQLCAFHKHHLFASLPQKALILRDIRDSLHLDFSTLPPELLPLAYDGLLRMTFRHVLPHHIQFVLIAPEVLDDQAVDFIQHVHHRVFLLSNTSKPWQEWITDTWEETRFFGELGLSIKGHLTEGLSLFIPYQQLETLDTCPAPEPETAEVVDSIASLETPDTSLRSEPGLQASEAVFTPPESLPSMDRIDESPLPEPLPPEPEYPAAERSPDLAHAASDVPVGITPQAETPGEIISEPVAPERDEFSTDPPELDDLNDLELEPPLPDETGQEMEDYLLTEDDADDEGERLQEFSPIDAAESPQPPTDLICSEDSGVHDDASASFEDDLSFSFADLDLDTLSLEDPPHALETSDQDADILPDTPDSQPPETDEPLTLDFDIAIADLPAFQLVEENIIEQAPASEVPAQDIPEDDAVILPPFLDDATSHETTQTPDEAIDTEPADADSTITPVDTQSPVTETDIPAFDFPLTDLPSDEPSGAIEESLSDTLSPPLGDGSFLPETPFHNTDLESPPSELADDLQDYPLPDDSTLSDGPTGDLPPLLLPEEPDEPDRPVSDEPEALTLPEEPLDLALSPELDALLQAAQSEQLDEVARDGGQSAAMESGTDDPDSTDPMSAILGEGEAASDTLAPESAVADSATEPEISGEFDDLQSLLDAAQQDSRADNDESATESQLDTHISETPPDDEETGEPLNLDALELLELDEATPGLEETESLESPEEEFNLEALQATQEQTPSDSDELAPACFDSDEAIDEDEEPLYDLDYFLNRETSSQLELEPEEEADSGTFYSRPSSEDQSGDAAPVNPAELIQDGDWESLSIEYKDTHQEVANPTHLVVSEEVIDTATWEGSDADSSTTYVIVDPENQVDLEEFAPSLEDETLSMVEGKSLIGDEIDFIPESSDALWDLEFKGIDEISREETEFYRLLQREIPSLVKGIPPIPVLAADGTLDIEWDLTTLEIEEGLLGTLAPDLLESVTENQLQAKPEDLTLEAEFPTEVTTVFEKVYMDVSQGEDNDDALSYLQQLGQQSAEEIELKEADDTEAADYLDIPPQGTWFLELGEEGDAMDPEKQTIAIPNIHVDDETAEGANWELSLVKSTADSSSDTDAPGASDVPAQQEEDALNIPMVPYGISEETQDSDVLIPPLDLGTPDESASSQPDTEELPIYTLDEGTVLDTSPPPSDWAPPADSDAAADPSEDYINSLLAELQQAQPEDTAPAESAEDILTQDMPEIDLGLEEASSPALEFDFEQLDTDEAVTSDAENLDVSSLESLVQEALSQQPAEESITLPESVDETEALDEAAFPSFDLDIPAGDGQDSDLAASLAALSQQADTPDNLAPTAQVDDPAADTLFPTLELEPETGPEAQGIPQTDLSHMESELAAQLEALHQLHLETPDASPDETYEPAFPEPEVVDTAFPQPAAASADPLDLIFADPTAPAEPDIDFNLDFQEAQPELEISLQPDGDSTPEFSLDLEPVLESSPEPAPTPASPAPAAATSGMDSPIPIHNKSDMLMARFKPGERVVHKRYGQGTIKRVITMDEEQVILNITFDAVGKRLLDPNLTQLEKVS